MSKADSVNDRYLALKPRIDAFPKNERGVLYIGYYPIPVSELIEIEHGLKQKLTPELKERFGEEMAAKIDEMRRELLALNLKKHEGDLERVMELHRLGNYLEKLGYNVGLDDVAERVVPITPSPEDLERMSLTELPTQGSYMFIAFEIEA